MIPTVAECINLAAFHLGDTPKRRYSETDLGVAVQIAWRETVAYFRLNGLPNMKFNQQYTFVGSTNDFSAEDVGIFNLGSVNAIWQVEGEYRRRLERNDELVPSTLGGQPRYYRRAGGMFEFDAPWKAGDVVRIEYFATGAAPSEGTLGIEGCHDVVSMLAAVAIGPTKGEGDLARELRAKVYEPIRGHMHVLIQALLKEEQEDVVQFGEYAGGVDRWSAIRQYR